MSGFATKEIKIFMSTYKPGDIVQSHYRARWYGIVTRIEKRTHYGDLISVYMCYDSSGNPHRKPKITKLDEAWLELKLRPKLNKDEVWVYAIEHLKNYLQGIR